MHTDAHADDALDAFATTGSLPPAPKTAKVPAKTALATFSEVRSGLKAQGFSPMAIISIIGLIMNLISEHGSDVQAIIDKIKAMFGK